MADNETDLILRAKQGDHGAFAQLVSRYDGRILGLARDMAGNADDARDIYQDALIAAYMALPRFRMQSSLFTWLYRITVSKALKWRRKRASGIPMAAAGQTEGPAGDPADLPAPGKSPEEQTLNRELAAEIDDALGSLSRKERMAFVLCHRREYRVGEAAELMSCSAGSVKSYLFRARTKMRRSLGPYLEG